MRHLVSTALVVILLLSLGALAVLARGGGDILSPAKAVPVAFAVRSAQEDTNTPVAVPDTQPEAAAPEAVAAGVNKLNNIGMPLIVDDQFASMGLILPYTAFDLADFIGRPGTDVAEVRRWNASTQAYAKCIILSALPTKCTSTAADFELELGGNYMVSLTSAMAQNVTSFVGGVPDEVSLQFEMLGATPTCKLNAITLPLDEGSVTNAAQLAASLGGFTVVQDVRAWNVTGQAFTKCIVLPNGNCSSINANFATQIGYPYWVCLKQPKTWP